MFQLQVTSGMDPILQLVEYLLEDGAGADTVKEAGRLPGLALFGITVSFYVAGGADNILMGLYGVGLAAVVAMLSSREPQRMLVAYLVVGRRVSTYVSLGRTAHSLACRSA